MQTTSTTGIPSSPNQPFQISWFIIGAVAAALAIFFIYQDRLAFFAQKWLYDENYGHGLFVPFIAIYIAWLKKESLLECYGKGSWLGLVVTMVGLGLLIIGKLGTLFIIQNISLWVVIVGLTLAVIGIRGTKILAFPLSLLLVTIPLPQFLFQGLTWQLRLISSTLGVGCLQLVGITAFQDGNVIDLGPIQLQVVEACSGLRFLFPLMTLALLSAYFFKDRMWKRIFLFLSSIPISIALNGFRIGVIGVLVESWGRGAADGFLHLFEGWIVFVCGLGLLGAEMWILKKLWPLPKQGSQQHEIEPIQPGPQQATQAHDSRPTNQTPTGFHWAFASALVAIVSLGTYSNHLDAREDRATPRQAFLDFPLTIGEWKGISSALDQQFIDVLRFDDYILADYRHPVKPQEPINLYVAYYQSQRSGQSIHSPKSCIPAGGWAITSSQTVTISPSKNQRKESFEANEVIIQKDDARQLVLYWFQQRHRIQTNEYLVKLFLMWDSLTKGRTDGALIRLTTSIPSNGDEQAARETLTQFTQMIQPALVPYIPQ